MLSHWLRNWTPRLFRPIVRLLARLGITPNRLTAAGLLLAGLTGLLAALDRLPLAGLALALSGLLDSLDGELARQTGQQSPMGAFLDSIADHYGDFAITLGITVWALRRGDAAVILLALAALFGSVVGSQIRSRAGMLGIDTKTVGLFTRAERCIVLILGLLTRHVLVACAVLALANNLSALQRLVYTVRASARASARDGQHQVDGVRAGPQTDQQEQRAHPHEQG